MILALEVILAPQDQRVILADLGSAILDQEDLRVTGVIKVHLDPGEVEETADQRATQVQRELQESWESPDPQESLDKGGLEEMEEEMVTLDQRETLALLNVMS